MKGTISGQGSINGNPTSSITIQFVGENLVVVSTDKEVLQPIPSPPSSPKPTPQPVTPTSGGRIDWSNQGGRQQFPNIVEGQTVTLSFTTTGDTSYTGNINVSEMTGGEGVVRRMWISLTPAGPAINQRRADVQGVSARVIPWSQGFNFLRTRLETNTTYYLNVQNISGDGGFYLNFGT